MECKKHEAAGEMEAKGGQARKESGVRRREPMGEKRGYEQYTAKKGGRR